MATQGISVPWKQICVTPCWFQSDSHGYEQAMDMRSVAHWAVSQERNTQFIKICLLTCSDPRPTNTWHIVSWFHINTNARMLYDGEICWNVGIMNTHCTYLHKFVFYCWKKSPCPFVVEILMKNRELAQGNSPYYFVILLELWICSYWMIWKHQAILSVSLHLLHHP